MRNPMTTAISFVFMAFGFVAILWAASSLSGRAYSQNRGAPPQPPGPQAPLPSAASPQPPPPPPQAPQMNNPSVPGMAMPEEDDGSDEGPMSGDPNAVSNGGAPGATQAQPILPGFNPEGYTYDPTGRRDPFMPFGAKSVLAQPLPMSPSVPSTLLPPSENSLSLYDLAQLKVVAIVWDVKDPKAMIMDPKGKLHMLHKDSTIGRNNGFVYAIREGEIVVVEPVQGENGIQSAMTRVMFLNGK